MLFLLKTPKRRYFEECWGPNHTGPYWEFSKYYLLLCSEEESQVGLEQQKGE